MTRIPTWPVHLPEISNARVHDYLARGKDNFASDRRLAELMLAADPAMLAMIDASRSSVRQAVVEAALAGIDQFVDLGCGIPRTGDRPLHDLAQSIVAGARMVYIDRDLQAVVTARAYHHAAPGVTVIDGDLTDPDALLSDPALAMLDLNRPVGVVCALSLPYLTTEQVVQLCSALAEKLPADSRMMITHPSGTRAQAAADIYREALAEHDVEETALARNVHLLESLLDGWTPDSAVTTVGPESQLVTVTARHP